MVNVFYYDDAPIIADEIKSIINKLKNPETYVLSLQLDYRENNTLFYLNRVDEILFMKDLVRISQRNGSYAFFNYSHILEYCVINAEDILDLGVV